MFGLFKKKMAPEGPVELGMDLQIDRPVEEVFGLIDWTSPTNKLAQMGHTIVSLGNGHFQLRTTFAPDEPFAVQVIEDRGPAHYAFTTQLPKAMGKLDRTDDIYELRPRDDGGTDLSLRVSATFEPGMTLKEFENEVARIAIATQNSATKLKIHAEHGLEASKAVENRVVI